MPNYEVNVRAIVTASRGSETPAIDPDIEDWEVYDFEANERDADDLPVKVTLRCDQFVKVSADSEERAIELAKEDATGIDIPGWAIDSVSLWVDEGIDVELIPVTPAAPGMAP